MFNLKKYVLSIIYKVKNQPENVDADFWDNLKIIDVLEVWFMFEVALTFMNQLIDLMVPMIGLYILFDWIGTFLFGRR